MYEVKPLRELGFQNFCGPWSLQQGFGGDVSPGTFPSTEPIRLVSSELLVPRSTLPSVWKNLLSGPAGLQGLGCPDAPRPAPTSPLLSCGTDFSLWVGGSRRWSPD